MSFQGDVRGIGLAELLQGLARGRKEGLLSLGGSDRSSCLIGLIDGRLILLPDEDERDDELAARIRIAFAHGLEDSVSEEDLERLGHAQRLESLYCLLDGGEVHFRFDPGDLAQLDAGITASSGTQLEMLLLEYARISDELEDFPDLSFLADNAVPQWVDANRAQEVPPRVLGEIDGRSTIQEIGDRLAWPTRQTRLTLAGLFRSGALRLSTHQELLALTLQEIEARQFDRACQRLRAWVQACPPGPMHPESARILTDEWVAGRLPAAMRGMRPAETRRLLRRLDAAIGNPTSAVGHWNEAVQIHPEDPICRMHAMGLQYAEDDRSDMPTVRDLLALARDLKEAGTPNRGAPLLLIAVQKKPEGLGQKLEVGLGLLEAGQPEHGGPWVLSAAHALVDRGQADRALGPLRTLIEAYPQSREAKALLTKAKRTSTQAKKMRRNLVIGGACLAALAGAALVKVRADHKRAGQLAEVRALIDTPDAALAALNRYFGDDMSANVLGLRRRIEESQRSVEEKTRDGWIDQYKAAQEAAKRQTPDLALEAARNLPAPPRLMVLRTEWPPLGDLYELMGKRLAAELLEQGEVQPYALAQVAMEKDLAEQAKTLLKSFTEAEKKMKEVVALEESLVDFQESLQERAKERARLELADQHRKNLNEQDRLRDLAEKAEAQGDYERARHFYQEILTGELDPRIREFIEPKVEGLDHTIDAITSARALAVEGQHDEALALLKERIANPNHYEKIIMPWKVKTFPSGARVTTDQGREYTTPFDIESATTERMVLTVTSPGFITQEITIEKPQDLDIFLSRTPESSWQAEGRVDAVPVPFGQDQIVVDRDGVIARIGTGEKRVWTKKIQTLSGVARAPVFFPGGSARMLLVTEEGSAWIVNADNGEMEGPWDLGSPPRVGPLATSQHIHVLLANGRWARWQSALQPVLLEEGAAPHTATESEAARYGPNNGLQVVRSREGEVRTLKSRFTGWIAEATARGLVLTPPDEREGFAIDLEGMWTFMAWEPASKTYPEGRLWISDGFGLRALIPRER